MIRLNNDYCCTAHESVLEAIMKDSPNKYPGYGNDSWCKKAEKSILDHVKCKKAKVFFLIGGTQTNATVIHSIIHAYQGVISADTGHINVNEAGAVENTGHKIITLAHHNGKISASQVEKVAVSYLNNPHREHTIQPKLVYISQPTEFGTLYSKQELTELRKTCDKYGLYLYADGARLAYALGSKKNDVSLEDMGKLLDVFYIGGTKCGAMFGEAVVICNPLFQPPFRSYMKQNGSMLAKGWLLGLMFNTLFDNNLYTTLGTKATAQAMKIKKALENKKIPMPIKSYTNQQFAVLSEKQAKALAKDFFYEQEDIYEDNSVLVRFCTSWSTTDEEVQCFIKAIEKL